MNAMYRLSPFLWFLSRLVPHIYPSRTSHFSISQMDHYDTALFDAFR